MSSNGSRKKKERGSLVAACGKWEEMIKAALKRNYPLCLLRAQFLTVRAKLQWQCIEKLAIFKKGALRFVLKPLLETLQKSLSII